MIRSMTAFGRFRGLNEAGTKDITAEIKSVNNRFLDCSVRLPRSLSYLEEKVKSYVSFRGITRGKVDVNIYVDVLKDEESEIFIDSGVAQSYISALKMLRDEFDLKDDISVMSVAQNRDIFKIKKPDDDIEKEWEEIKPILSNAIDLFIEAKEKEGKALGDDLALKMANIRQWASQIKILAEKNLETYPEKLETRIRQLLSDFDVEISSARILTEAAIFADKSAIDEELVRLETHLNSFEDMLVSDENTGRKLDFLLQEINREANTTASKSQDTDIAMLVVNIKSELEKIREQIQNIE